jgi:hypothetical protein
MLSSFMVQCLDVIFFHDGDKSLCYYVIHGYGR